MNRAGELSPDQIRNLTVSFAQLGYFNTQFKSIMADAIIEKLDQFDPAVLADTAWAFGEAQYYDYDLLSNLLPYLKSNIEKFDASGMSKVRHQQLPAICASISGSLVMLGSAVLNLSVQCKSQPYPASIKLYSATNSAAPCPRPTATRSCSFQSLFCRQSLLTVVLRLSWPAACADAVDVCALRLPR
jgi:hypothetical protein